METLYFYFFFSVISWNPEQQALHVLIQHFYSLEKLLLGLRKKGSNDLDYLSSSSSKDSNYSMDFIAI